MGSDEAILNLRPVDSDKWVGSGRFRFNAQSGTQRFLDRKSREFPLYLKPDLELKKASFLQLAESPRRRKGSKEKEVKMINAEPVIERHKRPFIIHPELHKKTYFNAVEKLLITP